MRPSELARRIGTSRQATITRSGRWRELGYVERRASGGGRRMVYLTERGRRVGEADFACLRGLQAEWAEEVGHQRFADFMAMLRHFAAATAQRA